jgi:hypothetical protein
VGVSKSYVDGSLNERDASITVLFDRPIADVTKAYVDGSLGLRDASIVDLYNTKQNTIADGTYVKEASLGDGLVWNAGQLDVSIADQVGVSQAYVDGSLNERDSSITALFNRPIVDVTKAYVDGSLGARDTSISWLNTNKISINQASDSSTATQVRFDRTLGYVYGTTTTPISSAITMSASDALLGVVDLIIHKDNSTGVSLPATFQSLAGTYDGSVNNFIYVQYIDPSTQLYTINQTS